MTFSDKQLVESCPSHPVGHPVDLSSRPVHSTDRECNVSRLDPKRSVFYFYEPVEQTVDRLVNRSSQRSPAVH